MQVYPERSRIIHLDEPLGEVANAVRHREMAMRRKLGIEIDEDEINDVATQACIDIARQKLEQQLGDSAMVGQDGIKHLLVNQRHLHKKGIMFTAFVFSIVIADLLGLEFVWSSDCKFPTCLLPENFCQSSRPLAAKKSSACMELDICWHNFFYFFGLLFLV